jgi:phosphoribosylformylglycinamidine (FGAM) synthase PurS component
METYFVEVIDRFEERIPARELVYSSIPEDCTVRETRVYEIAGSGSRSQLEDFVDEVLVDPVSQEREFLEGENDSTRTDFDHRLDLWLKDSVLDLEEEYLLEYCDDHRDSETFRVDDIRIMTRYYVYNVESDDVIETLVRDVANPVIHDWSVRAHADRG